MAEEKQCPRPDMGFLGRMGAVTACARDCLTVAWLLQLKHASCLEGFGTISSKSASCPLPCDNCKSIRRISGKKSSPISNSKPSAPPILQSRTFKSSVQKEFSTRTPHERPRTIYRELLKTDKPVSYHLPVPSQKLYAATPHAY